MITLTPADIGRRVRYWTSHRQEFLGNVNSLGMVTARQHAACVRCKGPTGYFNGCASEIKAIGVAALCVKKS